MNDVSPKMACAYYRTSSAANVSKADAEEEDQKDSLRRQQSAVEEYAARHNIQIVHAYYDAAVSGSDPINERPEFIKMLDYMLSNGARTILMESATRFARDLTVQLVGHDMLKKRGVELIPVDCPTHFLEETPTAVFVRQVMGAHAQFEKTSLVDKLRVARERKRKLTGRCEGYKPPVPEHVQAAKHYKTQGLSLRKISSCMADLGMVQYKSLKPYSPTSIKLMAQGEYDS